MSVGGASLWRLGEEAFVEAVYNFSHRVIEPKPHPEKVGFQPLIAPFRIALGESAVDFGADYVEGGVLPLLAFPEIE